MAAYEPGFEPTDSLECCLEKIKGKFFYFDDEKSSFAAKVLWNKYANKPFESKWHIIESIYYHVQIQVFIQTLRYL